MIQADTVRFLGTLWLTVLRGPRGVKLRPTTLSP